MLISPAIEELVQSEVLFPWKAPGVVVARRGFYATKNVVRALESPWPLQHFPGKSPADVRELQQEIVDVVALWQSGGPLLASNQIKPLRPHSDGVWTLSARNIAPGSRAFGVVPERNIFVATGLVPRSVLGQAGSPQWNTSIGVAKAMAAKWFPNGVISCPHERRFRREDLGVVCDDL